MSKDFDSTLCDALDLAARAARPAGPEAARIRGRKRTMNQRVAMSAAAFVLVAAGAATAITLASSGGGHTPHLTGGSPSVTTSASPTTGPTTSPTTGPTASATTSASTSQAASNPSGSGSGSPASSQPAVADPHQVVAAAWLSPDQMPFAGTFSWKAWQAPSVDRLTPTVQYVRNVESYQALTACGDPTKLLTSTTGGQVTQDNATSGNVASQFIFFFTDHASAQRTFNWLQSQYSPAACGLGPTVRITKVGGDGTTSAAWLTVKTGKSGPVDLSPYNREYFVLRGSTIAYVEIQSTASLPTTYDDAAQISTIASHLCVYGGPCD